MYNFASMVIDSIFVSCILIKRDFHFNQAYFFLCIRGVPTLASLNDKHDDIPFALSAFLDDLKPSHLNLSIQICP